MKTNKSNRDETVSEKEYDALVLDVRKAIQAVKLLRATTQKSRPATGFLPVGRRNVIMDSKGVVRSMARTRSNDS